MSTAVQPIQSIQLRANNTRVPGEKAYEYCLAIGTKDQGKSTFMRDLVDIHHASYKERYAKEGLKPRQFIHHMGSSAFRDIPSVKDAQRLFRKYVDASEKKLAAEYPYIILGHPMNVVFATFEDGRPIWQEGALCFDAKFERDIDYMYMIILDFFRNGMVLLDECSNYIGVNPKEIYLNLIINHRNLCLEVFSCFHGVLHVPNRYGRSAFITKMILFKTGEGKLTEADLKKKYAKHDKVLAAYNRVEKIKPNDKWVQPHEVIELS